MDAKNRVLLKDDLKSFPTCEDAFLKHRLRANGTAFGMALPGAGSCSAEVARQSPASQVAAGMLLSKQPVRKGAL